MEPRNVPVPPKFHLSFLCPTPGEAHANSLSVTLFRAAAYLDTTASSGIFRAAAIACKTQASGNGWRRILRAGIGGDSRGRSARTDRAAGRVSRRTFWRTAVGRVARGARVGAAAAFGAGRGASELHAGG